MSSDARDEPPPGSSSGPPSRAEHSAAPAHAARGNVNRKLQGFTPESEIYARQYHPLSGRAVEVLAEAAYPRTDLLERRRELMEAWTGYLASAGGKPRPAR